MGDKKNQQSFGRMLECYEIKDAIKSGKYLSLEDVLSAVERRAESIEIQLKGTKNFNPETSPNKETVDILSASYEASLPNTTFH